jgi:NodT family efflux transporter outer membrane factor (OMF) lipoprotein
MNTAKQCDSISVFAAAVGLAVLMASGGCMVGPNYHPPQPTPPPVWVGVEKTTTGQLSVATAQPAELAQWWRQFNDATLTALVEEAMKTNLDLQLAEARLRQARATRGVAIGGLWPMGTASGSYQREHTSGVTPDNQIQNLYQAGFDAVWELDLFGGLRRNVESANANVQAAIEGIRDAQVSLAAEVALNYIQLRGYQQEIVIAQNNLKAQQHTADITRKLLNVGFDSALDVANADANVATTESQIPVFETEAQQSIYALSVLLARPPADLLQQLSATANLPLVPAQVPVGLPSDLLRRRPDIREAEAQLHAATAQIGIAVADLFPKFSLTGTVSWNSNLLRTWWTEASRSFGVGPSVSWQIFQGGAIVSNIRVQEALRDQAFITYQQTVLAAFQDVENALIAFAKEQQHRKALNDAVIANRKAVDLSLQLYTEGQIDFLNVLVAQGSLYASEDALVKSECSIATDLIALYKALGGGWESISSYEQSINPTPTNVAAAETDRNKK